MHRFSKMAVAFTILAFVILWLASPMAGAQEQANTMEQNKEVSIQSIEMLWNAENPSLIGDYFASSFRIHTPTNNVNVLSSSAQSGYFGAVLEDYHRAFPDLVLTVEHVIAEGDFVVLHLSAEGTFEGVFDTPNGHGVQPNGDRLAWEDVFIYQFEDGKIVEWWAHSKLPFFGFDFELERFQ